MENTRKVGSVMVLGGGIAGMQSALDLANAGYYVYLVEKSSAIGGLMSQLDKTFPTNDCALFVPAESYIFHLEKKLISASAPAYQTKIIMQLFKILTSMLFKKHIRKMLNCGFPNNFAVFCLKTGVL